MDFQTISPPVGPDPVGHLKYEIPNAIPGDADDSNTDGLGPVISMNGLLLCAIETPSDIKSLAGPIVLLGSNQTTRKATGILTLTGVPVATDTLEIGDTTYTFVAAASAAGEITIGGTAAATVSNIIRAVLGDDSINATNGEVKADNAVGTAVVFEALVGGTAGNSIDFDGTDMTNATGDDDGGTKKLGQEIAGADSNMKSIVDVFGAALPNITIAADKVFCIEPSSIPALPKYVQVQTSSAQHPTEDVVLYLTLRKLSGAQN